MSDRGFFVFRPKGHNVVIMEDHFIVEHPITCDLGACNVFAACQEAWDEPPLPEGKYGITVHDDVMIVLAEAEPSTAYHVQEAGECWPGLVIDWT